VVIGPIHGDSPFVVAGVFSLSGRRTGLPGQVLSGVVRTGDHVAVVRDDVEIITSSSAGADTLAGTGGGVGAGGGGGE
jgi:translation elongation factor EF-Tu-like GTPase